MARPPATGDVIPSPEKGRCGYLRVRRPDARDERRRHHQLLQAGQVPTLQPDHLLQPAPDRPRRQACGSRPVMADPAPPSERRLCARARTCSSPSMPWNGYNYEDAVIVSQHFASCRTNTLSSIIEVRDWRPRNKLGAEEIARDLPNVGEDAVANLDERGVIASAPRSGVTVRRSPGRVVRADPGGAPAARHLRREVREVRDTSCACPRRDRYRHQRQEITREDAEEDGDELPNGVDQMMRLHRPAPQDGGRQALQPPATRLHLRILPEEDMPFWLTVLRSTSC